MPRTTARQVVIAMTRAAGERSPAHRRTGDRGSFASVASSGKFSDLAGRPSAVAGTKVVAIRQTDHETQVLPPRTFVGYADVAASDEFEGGAHLTG